MWFCLMSIPLTCLQYVVCSLSQGVVCSLSQGKTTFSKSHADGHRVTILLISFYCLCGDLEQNTLHIELFDRVVALPLPGSV